MTVRGGGATATATAVDAMTLAGSVTLRLLVDFPRLSTGAVHDVVCRCCTDLRGAPAAALPELVERSARQRLLHPTD